MKSLEHMKNLGGGGRGLRPVRQMEDFRGVLDECGSQHLGFMGGKFTWCNGHREDYMI